MQRLFDKSTAELLRDLEAQKQWPDSEAESRRHCLFQRAVVELPNRAVIVTGPACEQLYPRQGLWDWFLAQPRPFQSQDQSESEYDWVPSSVRLMSQPATITAVQIISSDHLDLRLEVMLGQSAYRLMLSGAKLRAA